MKVLIIWRLLTVGGVNAGWRNRAVFFKQHGIITEFLYTMDHGGLHIMQDVAQVYLTQNESEIRAIIRENHYDAIIVVDTRQAYKWIRKSNYKGPVIVEARTPELLKLLPHLPDLEDKGVSPVVMVTPSQFQKRLASIPVQDLPIEVIYNGIDTTFFRPLSDDDMDYQTEPVLPTGKKVVGWIGRLDKRKNWRMMLQIAKLIKHERDDIEFWVIGGAQSIERNLFATKLEEQQMTDIIKWFPVIPYQQIPDVYAKIRRSGGCYLATTKAESFGNTFIESMACGVPVIAPRHSSIPEIVVHGETGYLFREEHVRGATKQIYRLLDNPAKYCTMSQAATRLVQERFSIPIVADTYLQLLKRIVGHRPEQKSEVTTND